MGQIVTIDFHGDELFGFEREGGVFVALKPIVEAIGMDWSAQLKRVKRDPILSEGMAMMATPLGHGVGQEAACLRLELVNGWLFTIDAGRITDPAVRERVLLYQRECYAVLHAHFAKGGQAPVRELKPTDDLTLTEKRQLVTEARHTFDALSARELWFRLGLPITPAMIQPGQPALFTYTAEQQRPAA